MPRAKAPFHPVSSGMEKGIDIRTHIATQLLAGLMAKPSASSEGLDGQMKERMGLNGTEKKVEEAIRAADLLIEQLNQKPQSDSSVSDML